MYLVCNLLYTRNLLVILGYRGFFIFVRRFFFVFLYDNIDDYDDV